MTYAENLWLYTVLIFGRIAVPGIDMLFVLANALTGGRRAGLAATGGLMLGGAVHTLFGALAVGVILRLAPWLFAIMLFAGAAYMAWIGLTLVRSSITVAKVGIAPRRSLVAAFGQALVTYLVNPKAYLFVLSVFPQFLKPPYGPLWRQALVVGLIAVLMQLLIYGGLGTSSRRRSGLPDLAARRYGPDRPHDRNPVHPGRRADGLAQLDHDRAMPTD